MASPSVARLTEHPGNYIHWPFESSGYSVEIQPDVLRRLPEEIAIAEKQGVETGGLLLGSFRPSPVSMIRIEDFQLIAPATRESPIYMLNPEQQETIAAAARQNPSHNKTVPVGFFRSHLRPGPLTLSLADKSLLWKQFRSTTYCALLIGKEQPHSAACFVYAEGRMASQSVVPSFPFKNESVVEPVLQSGRETPALVTAEASPARKQQRFMSREVLLLCSVLIFAVGVVLWPLWQATFGGPWAASSPADIALSVQSHGGNVGVTWNRQMPEVSRAESATLTLIDGSHRQKVPLGKDDLKFGTVTYVHPGPKLQVNLTLILDDGTSVTQSAIWQKV